MKKIMRLLILALALLAMVLVAGCSGRDVVASVNGVKISSKDLDQKVEKVKAMYEQQGMSFSGDQGAALLDTLRKSTLQQMINNTLMLQEAKKMGNLSDDQIQEIVGSFKQEFSSESEYQQFLEQVELSERDVAYIINMQDQLVKELPPASDEEIRAYYEEYKDQMGTPEQLQVRHILFFVDEGDKGYPVQHTDTEAKQMAEDVIAQLEAGKDFSQLAKEKSEDSGTKAGGGLYTFSKGQSVQEFEDAAFT
jgi:peptidyl-prolyl cis-trans isomerase C